MVADEGGTAGVVFEFIGDAANKMKATALLAEHFMFQITQTQRR